MNPYDEQRLRNEVIYLHYLWKQGPPGNPNPIPGPRHRSRPENPSTTILHTPTHTTPFKKNEKKSWKRYGSATNTSKFKPGRDSGPEWPVNPTPQVSTGWPEVKPMNRPEPASSQDQAKLLAMQVQHKGIESCVKFFSRRADEDDESEELGDEDYLTENEMLVDSDVYKFLLELFVNDEKLRGYYEKNYESGDFTCLVCFGIGKNLNKRFKDCLGIVQHSIYVSNTKRKKAHRAFGQVVCKVLGWDIDRLPVIVLKGEPLGKSLANSGEDVAARVNDGVYVEHMTVVEDNGSSKAGKNGEVVVTEVTDVNKNGSELVICESSSNVDDVNKCLENPDLRVLNKEADKDIAVDCHVSDSSCVASSGWSCAKAVDENSCIASGWPTLKPSLVICSASAEEQVKLSAFQLQQKILDACRKFFGKSAASDGDENDDEDEDDFMDEDRSGESEVFKFFLKVFTENNEFRSYYEKNYEGGEFCCLVCGGIGKKVWKRFKDCLGLLLHSTGLLKTKTKRAHRAFGQVVCKVLGWDIDRLPMIVLKGEPLGHSLAKLGVSQASPNDDAINKYDNNVQDGSSDMKGSKKGATDFLE